MEIIPLSEGKSLTKEDEKTYWGKICYEDEIEGTNESNIPTGRLDSDKKDSDDNRRLLVKGSVIFGYGLEPQPVGRFVMSETTGIDDDEQDDEDDSEDGTEELDRLYCLAKEGRSYEEILDCFYDEQLNITTAPVGVQDTKRKYIAVS